MPKTFANLESMNNQKRVIIIETNIDASIEKVWESATLSEHITNWIFASDDWYSPQAKNDPREGGTFCVKMGSKDGTMGFDFEGKYKSIEIYKKIEYVISENREVTLLFENFDHKTKVTLMFDPESRTAFELQRNAWQAILNNFKRYSETL